MLISPNNTQFSLDRQILQIRFTQLIDFSIVDSLAEILLEIKNQKLQILLLDFSKTTFVKLEGALYILCIAKYLTITKGLVITQINGLTPNIEKFFTNIGFFTQIAARANGDINKNILIKEKNVEKHRNLGGNTIVFNISAILQDGRDYFDTYTKAFVNDFYEFFDLLISNPSYNYYDLDDEFQDLFSALYESIKNIYDHSFSEGFCSIYASSFLKNTTICFFDVGIGIAKSILSIPNSKFENQEQAIKWAFEDGNSSKQNANNQGHGFTIIKQFVSKKNGSLIIRTSNHQFIYNNAAWEYSNCRWFPGTQIIIKTPTL